jgi:DNA topoisomerase VI subunit B
MVRMGASMADARLERVPFKTSRLLDFIGRRELAALIGHQATDWPLVIAKELSDNAIDSCEEANIAPVVGITVSTTPWFSFRMSTPAP